MIKKKVSFMTAIVTHGRGIKHTCASCETRFFDLNKQPAICPKCGQKVSVAVKTPVRPRRNTRDNAAEAKDYSSHVSAVPIPARRAQPIKWK